MNRTRADSPSPGGRMVWAAGLVIAAGAGAATAHGLYEVAVAARVPAVIGWLYPLIIDGLALLAYAATARLSNPTSRRYAALIVVLAAGLSGLAQAVNLIGGITHTTAPAGLRFGVGAWPAIAAALTAHLLHLLHADTGIPREGGSGVAGTRPTSRAANRPVQSIAAYLDTVAQPRPALDTRPPGRADSDTGLDTRDLRRATGADSDSGGSASARARNAALAHHARAGEWPTARALADLAGVARGTAGAVLKELRESRPGLHVVKANTHTRTRQ